MELSIEMILVIIAMFVSFSVTIMQIVLPYVERRQAAAAAETERRERERMRQQLLYTALDYDFARDLTAGQETTRYQDMMNIIRSSYSSDVVPAGGRT